MKEFIFSAEGEPDIEALKRQMQGDESDPRSVNYVRKLIRPHINWLSIILNLSLPLLFAAALIFVAVYFKLNVLLSALAVCALLLIYILLRARSWMVALVLIYQRYAPSTVRNKCRFEPSCSQYMIISIQKHGAFKGLIKGIQRLRRCNVNGGGFDYP